MSVETKDAVVNRLLAENEEYKKLHEEHSAFESKLEELNQKKYLSPEEDVEFKHIKKLKLVGKDRMERILSATRAGANA